MQPFVWSVACAAVLATAVAAQDKQPAAAKHADSKTFTVGSDVDPTIALKDITGKTHTLKDYAGKVVLIDFWSIQCPVSKGHEARLKKVYEDYTKQGVVFLAIDANATEIDQGADPYASIKAYVKQQSVPYPILIDTNNVIADRFNAKTTPHIFIIDGKGKLRYAGGVDDDPEGTHQDKAKSYVRQALDALIAGKEPPAVETKPVGCSIKRVKAQG